MNKSSSSSAAASASQPPNLPATVQPTADQQHVLDRIDSQRERIQARRVARAQSVALSRSPVGGGDLDGSFALRAASFARAHPLVVLGLAGVAAVAGPRRMIRWAGVVLPMLMRLR
mgnify:CR=1 FL=1